MFTERRVAVRPANPADRNAILSLTRFEERVHAHLDWKPAEDWLGAQPFLLAERGRRVVGALACPPDPPDTAWLRLFAVVEGAGLRELWDMLWPPAREALMAAGVRHMAALAMVDWLGPLCEAAGLEPRHSVVVLSRPRGPVPTSNAHYATIRPARPGDYPAISRIDLAAFEPPWQMSAALVAAALTRADHVTVAEVDGEPVGYQMTTASPQGAHLARLAVLPAWQGRGIGAALVTRLIEHYERQGAREITVNTQDSNTASLRLYQRLGFKYTGTAFQVYQATLG